ncbi:MAG TPA: chromosomal replication initiator protein DnaA [Gaiella sp.]|uniref:chromosomal replication initiator protein DnaA n=1 Tax=Gaiella sp. TaxID=2663207 RepID=UPI002D7E6E22|nr:chromosomal replication initiator protein DnaA [Gaiella sp.]HET9286067.1 chromosomal replication initiator protein DnaA [Gaiella sp.]
MAHAVEPTAAQLWDDACRRLQGTLNETTYATWFAAAVPESLTDDTFVVVLPNDFTRSWIESHFLGLLRAALRDAIGRDIRVTLKVSEHDAAGDGKPAVEAPRVVGEAQPGANPKYTFDNFVIGSSNRFAHAAALAVAEAPAQAYNPLFIYGGTGLGKTHLLQAIGAYVSNHAKGLTTRYVTSETFTNDFINSLRDKRIEGFKHRYRAYDVLLVDDIQFLEGKERFQEEFFHTFNSLYEAGRQIVISSDRPPKEIATLEERLRSRFEWGLITDIQPPDLETRIAILRKKVTTDRIAVTDPEVLTFIAGRVSTNIRELEGALTRVVAFSSLTGLELDVDLAEQVLRDLFPNSGDLPEVTIARIQEAVCDRFSLTVQELVSPRRSQAVAYPRQVAMYLSRELTDSSLPKIGKEFGGRDHTTVLHANAKITRMISEDRAVYNLVQDLTARIKHRG